MTHNHLSPRRTRWVVLFGVYSLAAFTGALLVFLITMFVKEPLAIVGFALGVGICFVWMKKPKALQAIGHIVVSNRH